MQRLIAFIFVNKIQYPRILKNNIYHSSKEDNHHFLIPMYQSCTWPRSGPFCWQNQCSGCNCEIDLVVVVEFAFFQLCSDTEKISRFTRFRKSYVKHPAVVSTNHCQIYTTFLFDVHCSKRPCYFFSSRLSPMTVPLHNLFL